MPRPGWSATPLKTKGLLVALLPAVPVIVLWLLIGWALLQGNSVGPTLQVRDTLATLLRIQAALADERGAAYAGRDARVSPVDALAEAETLRARMTEATSKQLLTALTSAIAEERAALAQVRSRGLAVRDDEVAAYDAVVGANQALRAEREAWLAAFTATSLSRSRWIVYVFLAGSVLAVFGGIWLSVRVMRSITTRVDRVAAAADALVRGEARDIPALGDDEIGKLAQRLSEILKLLRVREEEVRNRNQALAAVNHELEAFSYSVSHDLRAPLRAIAGFSQILQEDASEHLNAASKDALGRVRAAAERMGVLIDQLLNLSRLSRVPLRTGPVDLSSMALEIVENLRRAEPQRNVKVDVSPGLSAVGDVELLKVALENLLSNAWKYTSKTAQPTIAFRAQPSPDGPVFQVQDNGAGFDMAHSNLLFGAFQRLHAQRDFEGTGVGLATVQRIVHRHGGRIWGEGAIGLGATFSMTLPVSGAAPDHQVGQLVESAPR